MLLKTLNLGRADTPLTFLRMLRLRRLLPSLLALLLPFMRLTNPIIG